MKKSKRAIIITGKLVQDHEYIYPYYRLLEEDYTLDVAVRGKETVLGAIGTKIVPTIDVAGLELSNYDLLVLPGGAKAMEYMRQDQEIIKFIADFYAAGKIISSICHAAQLLISANIVRGKKISGYYSIKDDINNAGAVFIDAPYVTDQRIITSPHYRHLGPWMKETIAQAESSNGSI